MRLVSALGGIAALAFASTAAAAPVTLAPVALSSEFSATLEDEYGVREGDYLRQEVMDEVAEALTRRGATIAPNAPVTIEIVLVDADPNRPTLEQASARPGLDLYNSISIGGAELRAVLRGANGNVLAEVEHRRYDHDIRDVIGAGVWGEANRAIDQFATKVADAYVAHAQ